MGAVLKFPVTMQWFIIHRDEKSRGFRESLASTKIDSSFIESVLSAPAKSCFTMLSLDSLRTDISSVIRAGLRRCLWQIRRLVVRVARFRTSMLLFAMGTVNNGGCWFRVLYNVRVS